MWLFKYTISSAVFFFFLQLSTIYHSKCRMNHKYLLNGTEYTGKVLQKTLPNGKPFRGGDINWEEPEGSRDGIIDDNDRMIIGNALPDVTGGLSTQFTYKDWSLFISFYYSSFINKDNYYSIKQSRTLLFFCIS